MGMNITTALLLPGQIRHKPAYSLIESYAIDMEPLYGSWGQAIIRKFPKGINRYNYGYNP